MFGDSWKTGVWYSEVWRQLEDMGIYSEVCLETVGRQGYGAVRCVWRQLEDRGMVQ